MGKFLGKILTVILVGLFIMPVIVLADGIEETTGIIFEIDEDRGYHHKKVVGGEKLSFDFTITNRSNEEKDIVVYPSDIISAVNGGMTYKTDLTAEDTLVGAWFTTGEKEITLKAGESKRLTYDLTVPKDLEAGQYIGVVAYSYFEDNSKNKGEEETSFILNYNYTMGIQIVLEKDVKTVESDMHFNEIETMLLNNGRWIVRVPVENKGMVLDKPIVDVVVVNEKDEEVLNNSFTFGSVYTLTDTYTDFYIDQTLTAGDYYGKAKMTDLNGNEQEKEFTFTVTKDDQKKQEKDLGKERGFKWWILAIILLVLLNILLLLLLYRKKKEKEDEQTSEIEIKDGEER